MPDERFEASLAAAMAILDHLASHPGLDRHARLSVATYTILEAMHRLDALQPRPSWMDWLEPASRN